MDKRFTEETKLTTYDVDENDRWKHVAILRQMSLISQRHCSLIDAPNADLAPLGMFWVLLRARIEMKEYPKAHDTVRITTWADNERGRIFNRHYVFETAHGERLGAATTVWLVLNRQTRQVTRLPLDCKITQYSATEYEAPMAQPRPIKFGFPVVATQKRSVMYSDLDENMHMNNTRYAEWICDLLGYERLHDVQISELQINFLHESDCTRTMELELSEQGRSFCVCGYDEQDRTRLFEAEGVLK